MLFVKHRDAASFYLIAFQGASLVVQWLRLCLLGVPGGSVIENPLANAGYMGLVPDLEQLSLCATTTEPVL